MTNEAFYGEALTDLEKIHATFEAFAASMQHLDCTCDRCPVEHYKIRIKSADSMLEKLQRRGFPQTVEAALAENHDAVGLRIVCTFLSGVYEVAQCIREQFEVIEEKDYIRSPKPNGYRSLHIIVRFAMPAREIFAEIQLRTIAMDCWASLEHLLKYKKEIQSHALIAGELKRCAEELASADLRMQTIEELIAGTKEGAV